MKKYVLILACCCWFSQTEGQVIFFQENTGSPNVSSIISMYTGWQNPIPVSFVSTSVPESEVRNTAASTGYPGASGNGNVFFTNIPGKDLVISGINTLGYTAITLSLGHYKNTTSGNNEIQIEVSPDGVNYSQLNYSRPVGTGTTGWILLNPSGVIPSTANLSIRFTQTSTTTQFRIDDITLAGIPNALPVHFAGVRVFSGGQGNCIEWSNLAEIDVISYAVERSVNGVDFETLSNIHASHNDGDRADYNWLDRDPIGRINFYRILSLESDGKRSYSNIVRMDQRCSSKILLYPNPVTGPRINMQAELEKGVYKLRILNAGGQMVYSRVFFHPGGLSTESIDLSGLRQGVYYLIVGEFIDQFVLVK